MKMKFISILLITFLLFFSNIHDITAQELTIESNFHNQWVNHDDQLILDLNRAIEPEEGRLAVFINETDITGLVNIEGNRIIYDPNILSLPAGESELILYLISGDDQSDEVGRFNLKARDRLGFERSEIKPTLEIGYKSQMFEDHSEGNDPGRNEYIDIEGGLNLQTVHERYPFSLSTSTDIFGTSNQSESLRFGQEFTNAPQIDLSQYLIELNISGLDISILQGHISYGSNKHLISGFSSRGLVGTLPLGGWADFTIGVMNGQSIVGWDNIFGLDNSDNLIVAGTLGINFLNNRKGELRLEITSLYGSLLSRSGFNDQSTTDTEESKGLGFRLIGSDPSDRFRFEGGVALSEFDNPDDPLLSQGFELIDVKKETAYAYYADIGMDILSQHAVNENLIANLTFGYHFEWVDPLFRSVAAFSLADLFQNTFELNGNIGDFNAGVSYYFSEDNLDNINSIMTTKTRRFTGNFSTPFVFLIGRSATPSVWYPFVSYSFEWTRQFGDDVPENSNFDSESQVPDQVNMNHTASLQWQGDWWRAGYNFNLSTVNNRQQGRENSDFSTLVNGLTLGFTPHEKVDFDLNTNLERQHDEELQINFYTERFGAIVNYRPLEDHTITTEFSQTFGDSRNVKNRDTLFNTQWSYNFTLFDHAEAQFFIRYFYQRSTSEDDEFDFDTRAKLWTVNSGLNITFN
jgi:hypothetical protein